MKIKFSNNLFLPLFILLLSLLSVSSVAAEEMGASERIRLISAADFYASDAGKLFGKGDFKGAIDAMEVLIQKYPGDALLTRYKAMALDLSGDSGRAIELFHDLLTKHPDHIPTHFFLGNAYSREGNVEAAHKEWQWVVENGHETFYVTSAQAALA